MIRIVLCTFNGERYIKEQLDSIIANTYNDWILYAFDDISSDNTVEILNEYEYTYPGKFVININTQLKGPQKNFLSAVFYVSHLSDADDYIMLCDQDDIWLNDKISKSYSVISGLNLKYGNGVPLLVSGDAKVVDENKNILSESYQELNCFGHKHLDLAHHLMENHIQGCTVMINKCLADLLYKIPQEVDMHDEWLGTIAYSMGHVGYIDDSLMLYRRYSESVTAGTTGFWKIAAEKIGHLSEQKEYVFSYSDEIKEFIFIYEDKLDEYDKELLYMFASLKDMNFIQRRITIIKYHMWKSGVIRNMGLMILI